ncbi:MAG: AMP-binding protein [Aquiluna sp.]|nr:AMP-binding protein [Aquiluna sp.]
MKPTETQKASDPFAVLKMMTSVFDGTVAGFVSPEEITGNKVEFEKVPETVADDIGLIVESSGSTGLPKRIELPLASLLASAEASATRLGGHGQWLLALPLTYIAGANVLFRSVAADTQPVIMNTRVPFSSEGFINSASLMQGKRRYTSLVPTQLDRLAANVAEPTVLQALLSFDAILIGGQAPNSETLKRLRQLGVKLVESYGMAETCGGCVYDGKPLDGVEVEVIDGLIAVSGNTLAKGVGEQYLSRDLGEIQDGRLKVLGRADRVIISGGKKVSLDHLENLVSNFPGVKTAMAVAVESEWGQSPSFLLVLDDAFDSESFVLDIDFEVKPEKVKILDALPMLSSGKPDYLSAAVIIKE